MEGGRHPSARSPVIVEARAFVRTWPQGANGRTPKSALIGVARCGADTVTETIRGYATMRAGGVSLCPTGWEQAPACDLAEIDASGMFTSCDWPRPAPDVGLDGGGILLRRLPPCTQADEGVHVVVGVFSGEIAPDQSMVDMVGDACGTIRLGRPECASHLGTNGMTMTQILRMPLWGWSDRPWGVTGTLRHDVAEACERLQAIRDGDASASPRELEALERGPAGSILGSGIRDDRYQRFRSLYRDRHGRDPMPPVMTASEQEDRDRRMQDVVRLMMAA